MTGTRIVGTGMHVPATVVTSAALEHRLRLGAGTIEASLGVRERRVTPAEEAVSDLAAKAGAHALADAGLTPGDVGLTILATSTPDHPVPATAPHLAHRLGIPGPAFDLMNTCSGWLYALAAADALLRAGTARRALVVGANVLSRRLDWAGDWGTAGLFGDGAGAVVLEVGEGRGAVLATALDAHGAAAGRILVPAGGSRTPVTQAAVAKGEHLLRMERHPGMLRDSVAMLAATARAALAKAGLAAGGVQWFLPHQASLRLVDASAAELGIPPDRALRNLARYGNTSAASIPILLHESARQGTLQDGDTLLLASVAAGMTSAAAVVRW